jgi:hypothetical protein
LGFWFPERDRVDVQREDLVFLLLPFLWSLLGNGLREFDGRRRRSGPIVHLCKLGNVVGENAWLGRVDDDWSVSLFDRSGSSSGDGRIGLC